VLFLDDSREVEVGVSLKVLGGVVVGRLIERLLHFRRRWCGGCGCLGWLCLGGLVFCFLVVGEGPRFLECQSCSK